MNCPKCGGRLEVSKTINKRNCIFRYRKCTKCKKTFKTKEMLYCDGWNYKAIVQEIKKLVEDVE